MMAALRFYTRLPLPRFAFEHEHGDPVFLVRALRLAPLAGLVLGGLAGGGLVLGGACGLPVPLAVTLALGLMIGLGGALHEDGLADVADGFGGGRTRARKLDIMRDSAIGSYGALAIGLSVALRATALAGLVDRFGLWPAAAAMAAAAGLSRGFGLLPLAALRPARADGLGATASQTGDEQGRRPWIVGIGLGPFCWLAVLLPVGLPPGLALGACVLSVTASLGVTALAARQIGGQTGDVAGAAQQAAEIAALAGLLIAPHLG